MGQPDYRSSRYPHEREKPAVPAITHDEAVQALHALERLEWGEEGLTRTEIRRHYPALPEEIFLRLPDSKRFTTASEVLHEAGVAASRAEGEYLGVNPDLPEADSIADGGPPAWGGDPMLVVRGAHNTIDAVEDGGSAEDAEGAEDGDESDVSQAGSTSEPGEPRR